MFVNRTIYVITFTSHFLYLFFYSKSSQIDILVRLVKILKKKFEIFLKTKLLLYSTASIQKGGGGGEGGGFSI